MAEHRLLVSLVPGPDGVDLVRVACACGWTGDPVFDQAIAQVDYLDHLTLGRCHACGQPMPVGEES